MSRLPPWTLTPRFMWRFMAKPIVHADNSVRKFGGTASDYFPIHDFLDKSKGALPDNRHRALTHTSWFISTVLELIHMPDEGWYGPHLYRPSDRVRISVRKIAEQHILEDFRGEFIPTASDFLAEMEIRDWMNNGANGDVPPSHVKVRGKKTTKISKLRMEAD